MHESGRAGKTYPAQRIKGVIGMFDVNSINDFIGYFPKYEKMIKEAVLENDLRMAYDYLTAFNEKLGLALSGGAFRNAEDKVMYILVVDETSVIVDALKSVYDENKAEITCVYSGGEALNLTREYTPDLIIIEVEMPDINGFELAMKLREKGYKAPIIFSASNILEKYVIESINLGAADFITKPINKEQVLVKIGKLMW